MTTSFKIEPEVTYAVMEIIPQMEDWHQHTSFAYEEDAMYLRDRLIKRRAERYDPPREYVAVRITRTFEEI